MFKGQKFKELNRKSAKDMFVELQRAWPQLGSWKDQLKMVTLDRLGKATMIVKLMITWWSTKPQVQV